MITMPCTLSLSSLSLQNTIKLRLLNNFKAFLFIEIWHNFCIYFKIYSMNMLNQPKVLVVDEDINILSAFEDFLNKEHCNLIAVSCIDEAMVHCSAADDLPIMDVSPKNN
jgi:hypothetical protein